MRDDTLVEPFAVPEIFVDGFTDYSVRNGIMSCVGYRIQPVSRENGDPVKVVVVRLIWPSANLDEAVAEAREAQRTPLKIVCGDCIGRH